jgi:nucleoid-associated protein EbfC
MFDQRAMRDMMKQAQQMQAQMEKAQQRLAEETVEGSAGGGVVTVTMSGDLEIKALVISKDVVDPDDVEGLQEVVLSAVKDAMEKAKALQQERMGAITGGLQLPF